MKDGNEGHGMNKKYEKFKLAVGTTFAFFILVAVMGIAFVQNRYADENILEDERADRVSEIQRYMGNS